MLIMDLSENIKAVRKARGITPTMMAKSLDIEPTNYPRLENRGNKLTYEYIIRIAEALGVSVVELITWNENKVTNISDQDLEKLQQDLSKSDELLKYQREKIEYLQSSSADLIVEMAFTEFDNEVGEQVKLIENPETGETDFDYPEEEWLKFLDTYLIQNDWAWELVERGITDEKAITKAYQDSGMTVAVPKDIKRKQRKRKAVRKKSVGGKF